MTYVARSDEAPAKSRRLVSSSGARTRAKVPRPRMALAREAEMFRFLIRRLLWAVFLFIAVTLVTYVIFFLAPANPERLVCGGERATHRRVCEQAREELALDRPIYHPVREVPGAAGDPRARSASRTSPSSRSTRSSRSAAPVTAALVFGGAILWMIIGRHARHPFRAPTALALRPSGDGVRPDRRLGAPGLARPDLLVLLRLQARLDADHRLLRRVQPARGAGLRRPERLVHRT